MITLTGAMFFKKLQTESVELQIKRKKHKFSTFHGDIEDVRNKIEIWHRVIDCAFKFYLSDTD